MGNGQWAMGIGHYFYSLFPIPPFGVRQNRHSWKPSRSAGLTIPHSPFPTPHSPLPIPLNKY
ncbi:hypothetical protein [Tolypothrix sp. VBCCA 56010]|uniref:hypothetical protein n=1 Tax=Tolypothrix sp. VBCCA 56010 TaxID=3137731 RepID=UPI003D7D998E